MHATCGKGGGANLIISHVIVYSHILHFLELENVRERVSHIL